MKVNNFENNLDNSNKLSNTKKIKELYEKKLNSKIIKRIEITNKKSQKKGYDLEIHLADGRILTIEEKFRNIFYPDLLLEIKSIFNGESKLGWLYKSEAEILAYFQPYKQGYNLTLWKLKELAKWTKSEQFINLVKCGVVIEKWSPSNNNTGDEWWTQNYAVSFRILRNKDFSYRNKTYEKTKKDLPIEFFESNKLLGELNV